MLISGWSYRWYFVTFGFSTTIMVCPHCNWRSWWRGWRSSPLITWILPSGRSSDHELLSLWYRSLDCHTLLTAVGLITHCLWPLPPPLSPLPCRFLWFSSPIGLGGERDLEVSKKWKWERKGVRTEKANCDGQWEAPMCKGEMLSGLLLVRLGLWVSFSYNV